MAGQQLQFEKETVQVSKQVEVAQVVISADDVAMAVLEIVKAAYELTGTETIRLPDYIQAQGLSVAVVRDLDA